MKHFLTSLINSGMVTILTSLSMTYINVGSIAFNVWLINWLVSWGIVFAYVFFIANHIKHVIYKGRDS